MQFEPSNSALILIDVQEGFISEYTSKALPGIESLINLNFAKVIATRFHNPPVSPFRELIGWHRLSTIEETKLAEHVEQSADSIVDKSTYGCGPQLLELLTKFELETAVVAGIDTDVCVLQNAAYLFDHGIKVVVDLNACATNGGPQADASAYSLLCRTIGAKQTIARSQEWI